METTEFHAKSTAYEVVERLKVNLDGKIALVTGATSGFIDRSVHIANIHRLIIQL